MDNKDNAPGFYENLMTLREPKKKRRTKLRPRKPFPINIGSDGEWTVYTGHLTNLGVCITEPEEMEAIHSMGFFGKGSLSRSFPNFEKTRYGVPPILRKRQWDRRQVWLQQTKNLKSKALIDDPMEEEWTNVGQLDSDDKIEEQGTDEHNKPASVLQVDDVRSKERVPEKEEEVPKIFENINPPEKILECVPVAMSESSQKNRHDHESTKNQTHNPVKIMEVVEDNGIHPSNSTESRLQKSCENGEKMHTGLAKVDEVVLDSSEDEICEISHTETAKPTAFSVSSDTDIILLNDDAMSIDSEEQNYCDTKKTNIAVEPELQEKEVLVLPDSDSDTENYLSNVKPTIELEGFPVRETLYLMFEEAFFLMFGLGCLEIVNFEGNLWTILDAWNYFCHTQKDFVQKYVIYHYFRSKGWVVKSGLKYGGDFLLYKQGPPFYHASYIVIVEVLDENTLLRDNEKTTRKMTWQKLFGLDRLSETAAKEILFAQVLWPSKIPRNECPSTPELLSEFTVKELLYRRWIPKQNREEIHLDDDNDESQ